ncbi:MAG TPA: hypothetical protein VGJ27_12975 [Gaiellaceae bacterium]|jgi:hypothetical protein
MDTVLGLLGLIVFAACVIVLAAATTWVVVKLSPVRRSDQQT